MKNKPVIVVLSCLGGLVACSALGGCQMTAGQSARRAVLAPAVVAAWPDIRAMAIDGANARHDADSDDAAWHIDLDLIDQFDDGIKHLGGE